MRTILLKEFLGGLIGSVVFVFLLGFITTLGSSHLLILELGSFLAIILIGGVIGNVCGILYVYRSVLKQTRWNVSGLLCSLAAGVVAFWFSVMFAGRIEFFPIAIPFILSASCVIGFNCPNWLRNR